MNPNLFRLINYLFISSLWATPRYALESGASCNLCHFNPNGGGLRNDYGIIYGMDDLAVKVPQRFESYSGIIINHIQFGGDVRIQSVSRTEGDIPTDLAIFPMQANLQMAYRVNRLSFQSEWGLLRKDLGFQIGYNFKNYYVQSGMGKPSFGLKLSDHTVFTRGGNMRLVQGVNKEGMPFTPLLNHAPIIDVGRYFENSHISIGWSQGYFSSDSKSINFRGENFGALGSLNRMVGFSFLQEKQNTNGLTMMNAFGGVSGDRFSWLGEITMADNLVEGRSIASYSELIWRMKKGWNISGRIDFFDESMDYTQDAIRRTTFGLNYVPLPFTEIKFQIRSSQLSSKKASSGLEFLFQLHIWF